MFSRIYFDVVQIKLTMKEIKRMCNTGFCELIPGNVFDFKNRLLQQLGPNEIKEMHQYSRPINCGLKFLPHLCWSELI